MILTDNQLKSILLPLSSSWLKKIGYCGPTTSLYDLFGDCPCEGSGSTLFLDNTLTGTGSLDNLLRIAQQNATTGQVLAWDGSTWMPSDLGASQTLSFAGTNLSISNGNTVDLSSLLLSSEDVQDIVGPMFTDSVDLDFTYTDGSDSITAILTTTGVTAATYGSTSLIPVITVNSKGRITAASTVAVPVTSVTAGSGISVTNNGSGVYTISTSGGYSDEDAQDAVGGILTDTDTIDFTYTDGSGTIEADVIYQLSIAADTSGLKLVNDSLTPGNYRYYGTNNSGTKGFFSIPVIGISAGGNIGVSNSSGVYTITNNAPDQTVVLNAGTGISISGSYPTFTITNSAPDQTVTLTGASGVTITGTYPNFTIGGSISQYDDEQAQDAIGTILLDTDTITWTYDDTTPTISADVVTQMSITSDSFGLRLVSDSTSPGNLQYYGTNGSGVKGWYSIPASVNIYNSDGILTGDRNVQLGGNALNFYYGVTSSIPPTKAIKIDASGTYLSSTLGSGNIQVIEANTSVGNSAGHLIIPGGVASGMTLKSATTIAGEIALQIQNGVFGTIAEFLGDRKIKFNIYTSPTAVTGTAVAGLAVDSSGNVITTSVPLSSAINIYNSDDVFTGDRIADLDGNDLRFDWGDGTYAIEMDQSTPGNGYLTIRSPGEAYEVFIQEDGTGTWSGTLTNINSEVQFQQYTSTTSFPGTATAYLAVNATGNVITVDDPTTGIVIENIYNSDGSLTDDRELYMEFNDLTFYGGFEGGIVFQAEHLTPGLTSNTKLYSPSEYYKIKLLDDGSAIFSTDALAPANLSTFETEVRLEFNKYLVSDKFCGGADGASTPTLTAEVALGTAPTTAITATDSSDVAGRIQLTVGSSPTSGLVATVDFVYPYDAVPTVQLQAESEAASEVSNYLYVVCSTDNFEIHLRSGAAAWLESAQVDLSYQVIQGKR